MTSTNIEGLNYLLVSCDNGDEFVSRYLDTEMAEVFTADERQQLTSGKAVVKPGRLGALRYVDMVAAARSVVN